ncbi:MAG: L-aspartate oxidase [Candidatus Margulisbacteria bacterium]|nr:L-aspartate oxidase [Candidatus Margulisiibacteriota bacterium]MBU1021400.1 L-aspartate oxidase [Candidatus Margulisiibacteriota bacterium]MBU1729111.1 L-aspartate oxidase [Candidatus Margulisiibacteriota bacterium]MBU1954784.1 L-aspartate oxidase [Candidatus Margulisiibacteriota bacterium]
MPKNKTIKTDLLIIGGGIAGLRAAIEASKHCKVLLITKGKAGESATEKAQGGIAAAIDKIQDSTEFHFQDTIKAGAGLCDKKAVEILVNEGVSRVIELIKMGARFDRAETEGGTGYSLAIEGAHKRRRILHAGDETGAEIERTLGSKIISDGLVKISPYTIGIDLIIKDGKCIGATAIDTYNHLTLNILAKATIIATGGICQTYLYTTNPGVATGDGVAMAWRAGAEVQDMEFIQFHPTSLVAFKELEDIIALPRFLISEAVRGEGAKLINVKGERFMPSYHKQKELAPRDIVSRAIVNEMKKTKSKHVWLSLSGLGAEKIKKRFPMIYKTCLERGLDITKENIPVAPAAHYFMGGIKTTIEGETNLPGLYAAGESVSLGVHGANRLASNSLLDGLVFGTRAAKTALKYLKEVKQLPKTIKTKAGKPCSLNKEKLESIRMTIRNIMWKGAGILRNGKGLKTASQKLKDINQKLDYQPKNLEEVEVKNLGTVAGLILKSAIDRKESRGAHFRTDYPQTDNQNWKKHLIYSTKDKA